CFSSRRRHTRLVSDWSSDVCSSDLGLTAFLALARILGSGWRALPGAFLALTVSAGAASGVEGGIHIGMVGARLAWAFVPLLVLASRKSGVDGKRGEPRRALAGEQST